MGIWLSEKCHLLTTRIRISHKAAILYRRSHVPIFSNNHMLQTLSLTLELFWGHLYHCPATALGPHLLWASISLLSSFLTFYGHRVPKIKIFLNRSSRKFIINILIAGLFLFSYFSVHIANNLPVGIFLVDLKEQYRFLTRHQLLLLLLGVSTTFLKSYLAQKNHQGRQCLHLCR